MTEAGKYKRLVCAIMYALISRQWPENVSAVGRIMRISISNINLVHYVC